MSDFPKHIAIIMDGNGRWAGQRSLPRTKGHETGIESVKKVIDHCVLNHIEVLTLFAFGRENWRRPEAEVEALMQLYLRFHESMSEQLHKNHIRVRFVGERVQLSDILKEAMAKVETLTASNTGMTLIIAVNYSGRWDIVQAAKACHVQGGGKKKLTQEVFRKFLCFDEVRDPDLLIRTGGERRLSNFLLWQMAYTELYFVDTLWPDFETEDLAKALAYYASRKRRFGLTDEQIRADQDLKQAVYI